MDGVISTKITADVTNFNAGMKSATITIGGMEQALKDLRTQLKSAQGDDIARINVQIKGLTDALIAAKAAGIEPAISGFEKFEKASHALSYELRGLGEATHILLGFGAFKGIELIRDAIIGMINPAKEADDTFKKTQKSLDEVTSGFAKEEAKVDSLVATLQRGNLTHLQTKTAIEELQKISPEYFGNLDKEHLSIQQLTKDYNAYNAQVINAIETQLKLKDVTDIIQQRLDFEKSAKDASAEFSQLIGQGKSLADIAKIANDRIQEQSKASINLLQSEKGRYANAKDLTAGLAVEATALLKIVQLRQQEAEILKTVTDYGKENLKDVQAKTDELVIQKVHISPQLDIQPPSDEEELIKSLKPFTDKINEIVKHGSLKPLLLPAPKLALDKDWIKAADEIAAKIKSVFEGIASDVGEALGNLISGVGFGNFIQNLGHTIGEGLKSIGKILIQTGIEMGAIKKALEDLKISPELAVVAGVAAIALGTIIENSAKSQVSATKFATGGVVTGPTLGLIGEAGPEVVFPLDRLNQFIRKANTSNNVNVGGRLVVQGTDLVTVINRTNKNQGLV